MILVTVGEHHAQDPLTVLDHIGEIWQYQVDAEHLVVGKHETRVHDEEGVAVLQHRHVLADCPQTTQGYDFESFLCHGWGSEPPSVALHKQPARRFPTRDQAPRPAL